MKIMSLEAKEKYIQDLEMESIKAKLLAETEKLIAKKKVIQALKESHRDLISSREQARSDIIRNDLNYGECKNTDQRNAYLAIELTKEDNVIETSDNEIQRYQLELDIAQDNLKFLKYQARLVVSELQFMAD